MNPFSPYPLNYTYHALGGTKKWVKLSPEAVRYLYGDKKLKTPKKGKRFRYYRRKIYERRRKGLFWYIEQVTNKMFQAEIDKALLYGIGGSDGESI